MEVLKLDYTPIAVVDTVNLTREEWLEYRRTGIGGSDASTTMGLSPFVTARDLYYDKLNIVSAIDDESNWVQKEIGNLLEDLVAKIFHVKTGYKIFQRKIMYRHPLFPFMLADLDYFIKLPDQTTAILEIKTTNANAIGKWWDGDREIIPINYALQGRHYMSVMNVNKVFFCCLYGNSEDEVIIRHLDRDLIYEAEMIYMEKHFWENHVLTQVPPPYTESGRLILNSVKCHFGNPDSKIPSKILSNENSINVSRYLELQQQKSELERPLNVIKRQMDQIKGHIVAEMERSYDAFCDIDGYRHRVSFAPSSRTGINKDNLFRFKMEYPELYKKYVTVSESRRFSIKQALVDEEKAA